jgi:hypothetical protein
MPIPEVARRLGHATPAITMSIYAHAIGELDRGGSVVAGFLPDAPPALPEPQEPAA